MHTFLVGIERADFIQFFLDELFYGLHVVVCDALNVLHAGSVGFGEVRVEIAQGGKVFVRKVCQLGQGQFAQGNEVLYFDTHAILHQGVFGEVGCERFGF